MDQVLKYLAGTLDAGGLQGIIIVPAGEVGVGPVLKEELGRLEAVLLDGVVEGSLVLDVLSVDVGPILQKVLAELHTLDRVDEAGAPVVVRLGDVGPILHQVGHNVQVGHEAGAPDGGRARVGDTVDVRPSLHQAPDHRQPPSDGGAPKGCYVVDGPVVGHLVEAALLHVGVAEGDEVVDDLDVASLAGDEERGAAVLGPGDDLGALRPLEAVQPGPQHVGEPGAGGDVLALIVEVGEDLVFVGRVAAAAAAAAGAAAAALISNPHSTLEHREEVFLCGIQPGGERAPTRTKNKNKKNGKEKTLRGGNLLRLCHVLDTCCRLFFFF